MSVDPSIKNWSEQPASLAKSRASRFLNLTAFGAILLVPIAFTGKSGTPSRSRVLMSFECLLDTYGHSMISVNRPEEVESYLWLA